MCEICGFVYAYKLSQFKFRNGIEFLDSFRGYKLLRNSQLLAIQLTKNSLPRLERYLHQQ